ncbi:MAG: RecQ family zinc-binding domain-containing protein [Acidobacteria bacterium]|nr:RecQ family zinc-binding domain-containing protein [Acidobacteriota bacterium]
MSLQYKTRNARDRDKLDRMIAYGQTALCRWKVLMDYFGDEVAWTARRWHFAEEQRRLAPVSARQRVAVGRSRTTSVAFLSRRNYHERRFSIPI